MSTLQAVTATAALAASYIPPQNIYPASNGHAIARWEYAVESNNGLLKKGVAPLTEEYMSVRLPASCYYPLEVIIIQDRTYSFVDDLPVMYNSEISQMVEGILANHPGSTFGVVSHTDKPIIEFGWPETDTTYGDWCWLLDQPLSPNEQDLLNTYGGMFATGGYDYPENQYGALINAIQSSVIGWGSNPLAAKLIVHSTDSPAHYKGDGSSNQGMADFSGTFDEANADQQCVQEFYPTPQQTIDTVLNTTDGRIPPYVAFVIFDGDALPNNQTIESWRWFAGAIGEDDRFVRDRTSNSDNFWEQLSQIIGVIDGLECGGSTTAAPTTSAATTTEPTTTPTTTTEPTTTPTTTTESTTTPTTTTESTTTTVTTTEPITTPPITTESTTTPTTTTESTTTTVTTTESAITTELPKTETTVGPCPQPCPCPCPEPHCGCGNKVELKFPKGAKTVDLDLHMEMKRV